MKTTQQNEVYISYLHINISVLPIQLYVITLAGRNFLYNEHFYFKYFKYIQRKVVMYLYSRL